MIAFSYIGAYSEVDELLFVEHSQNIGALICSGDKWLDVGVEEVKDVEVVGIERKEELCNVLSSIDEVVFIDQPILDLVLKGI